MASIKEIIASSFKEKSINIVYCKRNNVFSQEVGEFPEGTVINPFSFLPGEIPEFIILDLDHFEGNHLTDEAEISYWAQKCKFDYKCGFVAFVELPHENIIIPQVYIKHHRL